MGNESASWAVSLGGAQSKRRDPDSYGYPNVTQNPLMSPNDELTHAAEGITKGVRIPRHPRQREGEKESWRVGRRDAGSLLHQPFQPVQVALNKVGVGGKL
jgi:hypothetical protein